MAAPLQSSTLSLEQSWVVFKEPIRDSRFIAPKAAVPFSDLTSIKKCETASGHDVYKMELRKGVEKKVVYYKQCCPHYPSHMAQIESANSTWYRLVRGKKAAKVRPVVDVNGKVVGSISYDIEGFQSFDGKKISAAAMIELGIEEELVARYVRKEDDLHPGNIGISPIYGVVGIDFDRSQYPITSKINGARIINSPFAPAPADSFPITDEDLTNFPNIKACKPCFWPTKYPNNGNWKKDFANRAEFIRLSSDPKFNPKKNYAFLKEILLYHNTIIRAMEPNFSDTDEIAQQYFSEIKDTLEKDLAELEERLTENAGFRRFILDNKHALQCSLKHFEKYNKEIAEYGFQIDLDEVKEKYLSIVKKCMIKDLTNAMYDLGYELKSNQSDWDKFSDKYNSLLDCFIRFQRSKDPFLETFLRVEFEFLTIVPNSKDDEDPWSNLCKNLSIVLDNYRGFLTKTDEVPVKSIMLRHSVDNAKVSDKKSMDVEGCLAKAMHTFITNSKNREKIIHIASQCLDSYRPFLHGTTISGLNPFNYSRARVAEIEEMISNLQKAISSDFPVHIKRFLEKGSWNVSLINVSMIGDRHSANVLLISKLCQAALDSFKRRISFKQLKEHDLVEISYALQRKDCYLENLAEKIATKFFEIILKGPEDLTGSLNL